MPDNKLERIVNDSGYPESPIRYGNVHRGNYHGRNGLFITFVAAENSDPPPHLLGDFFLPDDKNCESVRIK